MPGCGGKNGSGESSLTGTVTILLPEVARGTDFGEKMKCLFLEALSSRHWAWRSRRRSLLEIDLYLLSSWNKRHKIPLIITACI